MPKALFSNPLRGLFPQRIAVKLALIISLVAGILISVLGITLTRVTENVLKTKVKTSHRHAGIQAGLHHRKIGGYHGGAGGDASNPGR